MVIAEIAGLFPVENADDLYTDRYNYKKRKSTDAIFAKIVVCHQYLQFVEKTVKCMRFPIIHV